MIVPFKQEFFIRRHLPTPTATSPGTFLCLLTKADPGGQMLASLLKTVLQKNHLYFARYVFWTIWLVKEHLRATSELRSMTHLLLRFRAAFSQVQRDECSGFNLTWYCTYRMSEMILIVSLQCSFLSVQKSFSFVCLSRYSLTVLHHWTSPLITFCVTLADLGTPFPL